MIPFWVGRALRAFAVDLADGMLGRTCPGCGGSAPRGGAVCADCDAMVPRAGEVLCLRCMQEGAEPTGSAERGPTAADAAPSPGRGQPGPRGGCPRHGAERLLLAGPVFEPPLDRIVHAFKYSGARDACGWLASLLPEPPGRGEAAGREYVLVPVPLHPARRAWRGFDQARLLAETAGAAWGIPVAGALERRRDTPPQARTGAAARRGNVSGAFRLVPHAARLVERRAILLVDDVATTGSTLLEAASALDGASPSWILSLAAAHGGLPRGAEPPSSASVAATSRV